MNIKELQKHWNGFGKTDPLWAILTWPDKKGNKWRIEEFFETGVKEIDGIMKYVESLGVNISFGKALDFGCGVGRLTQALARYFDEVCGIDIAPSMINLANKYNRYGDKCKYFINDKNDLKLFPDNSFNFIYSCITLQHMEPQYSKNYIREFLRILAPHGLAVFQLPSELLPIPHEENPRRGKRLKEFIKPLVPNILLKLQYDIKAKVRQRLNRPIMEMYGIAREEVVSFLEENGGRIANIAQDGGGGPYWMSFRYCVAKNGENTSNG